MEKETPNYVQEEEKEKFSEEIEIQFKYMVPFLREIGQDILKKKPDLVVGLDQSARIFLSVLLKYIRKSNSKAELPEFVFQNDDEFKRLIKSDSPPEEVFKHYGDLKGKKILIIDEDFANGSIMSKLVNLCHGLNRIEPKNDTKINFYALAVSPEPHSVSFDNQKHKKIIFNEEVQRIIERAKKNPNFTFRLNENLLAADVFSRYFNFRYTKDVTGKDKSIETKGINYNIRDNLKKIILDRIEIDDKFLDSVPESAEDLSAWLEENFSGIFDYVEEGEKEKILVRLKKWLKIVLYDLFEAVESAGEQTEKFSYSDSEKDLIHLLKELKEKSPLLKGEGNKLNEVDKVMAFFEFSEYVRINPQRYKNVQALKKRLYEMLIELGEKESVN